MGQKSSRHGGGAAAVADDSASVTDSCHSTSVASLPAHQKPPPFRGLPRSSSAATGLGIDESGEVAPLVSVQEVNGLKSALAMQPPTQWTTAVELVFRRLRDEDRRIRQRAMRELRRLMDTSAAELSPEQMRPYQRTVRRKLEELWQSDSPAARMGSVEAVSALVDVEYIDASSRSKYLAFFYTFLKHALRTTNDPEQAEMCARTIGQVLRIDSALRQDVVVAEAKGCLEWLQELGPRSYAAGVTVRELAQAAPELALPWLAQLAPGLRHALKHDDKATRRVAARAAAALFKAEARRFRHHEQPVRSVPAGPRQPERTQGTGTGESSPTQRHEEPDAEGSAALDHFVTQCLAVLRAVCDRALRNPPGLSAVASWSSTLSPGASSRTPSNAQETDRPAHEAGHTPPPDDLVEPHAAHGALLALRELVPLLSQSGKRLRQLRSIALTLCESSEQINLRLAAAETLAACAERAPLQFAPMLESACAAIFLCGEEICSTTTPTDRRSSRSPHDSDEWQVWHSLASIVRVSGGEACSLGALRDVLPGLRSRMLAALEHCPGAASSATALLRVFPGDPVGGEQLAEGLLAAAESLTFGPQLTDALSAVAARDKSALPRAQELVIRRARAELHPEADAGVIEIVLEAIAGFDFQGRDLSSFCESHVVGLLDHNNTAVRRAAAAACCALLSYSPPVGRPSQADACLRVVLEVLRVAVADIDCETRLSALRCVRAAMLTPGRAVASTVSTESFAGNSSFPHNLARPHGAIAEHLADRAALAALGAALSDEAADVREVALDILARLRDKCPAANVRLERLVRQVTTELECTVDGMAQENAARILARLAQVAPQILARQGVPELFTLLYNRLRVANTSRLRATFLQTFVDMFEARLSERWDELPALVSLTDLTAEMVAEPSSTVTAPAAQVLGLCIRCRGTVGTLLQDHSLLLMRIFECFDEDGTDHTRRTECMRLLGIIGAVDPHHARRYGKQTQKQKPLPRATAPDYDAHQVVQCLIEVLEHPPMVKHRRVALQALQQVMRSIVNQDMGSARSGALLARVVPALVRLLAQWCADSDSSKPARDGAHCDQLLHTLQDAVSTAQTARPGHRRSAHGGGGVDATAEEVLIQHLSKISQLMHTLWELEKQDAVIDLAIELEAALGRQQVEAHLRWLAPKLVETARRGHTDRELALKAVEAFEELSSINEPFISPVVGCLVDVGGATDMASDLRVRCVQTLSSLAKQGVPLIDVASRAVHGLIRIAQGVVTPQYSGADERHREALSALCAVAQNIGAEFDHFQHLVQRALSDIDSGAAREAAVRLASHLSPDIESQSPQSAMSPGLSKRAARLSPPGPGRSHPLIAKEPEHVRTVWRQYMHASTDADYHRWLDTLARELLTNSPKDCLRACADAGLSTPQLARRVFATSFAMYYNSLQSREQKDMAHAVQCVISRPSVPSTVLRPILNLALFVERTYAQHFAEAGREHPPVYKFGGPSMLSATAGACQNYGQELHWLDSELYDIGREMNGVPCAKQWPDQYRERYKRLCMRQVRVNRCLELPSQAEGILRKVQSMSIVEQDTEAHTYEQIGWWEKAFELHMTQVQAAERQHTENIGAVAGTLRCKEQIGQWDSVLSLADKYWKTGSDALKKRTARAVSHASWMLEDWDRLRWTLQYMPQPGADHARHPGDSPPGCTAALYRAILEIRKGGEENFVAAQSLIDSCRSALQHDVAVHVGNMNTPDRALRSSYELVVMLQHLSEAEEVMNYLRIRRLAANAAERAEYGESVAFSKAECDRRLAAYRQLWSERLRAMRHDPWHMRDALELRALAMSPHDFLSDWLHFVDCLGDSQRALRTLRALLGRGDARPHTLAPPYIRARAEGQGVGYHRLGKGARGVQQVIGDADADPVLLLNFLQRTWEDDRPGRPLLFQLFGGYASRNGFSPERGKATLHEVRERRRWADADEHSKFAYDVLVTYAQWQSELQPEDFHKQPYRGTIDSHLSLATKYLPNGHLAWHSLALLHLRAATKDQSLTPMEQADFASRACDEFVTSIKLCDPPEMAQQDMLRLLRLCCTFGPLVRKDFNAALAEVPPNLKAAILPQIVARIDEPPPVRNIIRDLLCSVAENYPQRVLLALAVTLSHGSAHDEPAAGTRSHDQADPQRYEAARLIRDHVARYAPELTEEVELVTRGLVRLNSLAAERWYQALLDVHPLVRARDIDGVCSVLLPLHKDVEEPPNHDWREFARMPLSSKRPVSCGDLLSNARSLLLLCREQGGQGLESTWAVYIDFGQRLRQLLSGSAMSSFQLKNVAPELLQSRALRVAVPGVLQDRATGEEIITIARFVNTLQVMNTQRRPRKLSLFGTDGCKYTYLLKGQEDLRLDQRVMQLLALTNTLLRHDSRNAAKSENTWNSPLATLPQIVTYPVVPLSVSAGLLGWVPDAQTLEGVVKEMRGDAHYGRSRQESTYFVSHLQETMMVIQRAELLDTTLRKYTGDDIHLALWLRASRAAEWVDNRTRFARSLAIMSMLGYVLGLGDRHPGNLMLKGDGTIVHIDFGDCFEVAQNRDQYPERVPFRLTRMLVRAMGVGGAEGVFRHTAQSAMGVLRREQSSVMAMLEAFVHDPLITWRLVSDQAAADEQEADEPPQLTADARDTVERPAASCIVSLRQLHRPEPTAAQARAQAIVQRIQDKLDGYDFPSRGAGLSAPSPPGSPAHLTPLCGSGPDFPVTSRSVSLAILLRLPATAFGDRSGNFIRLALKAQLQQNGRKASDPSALPPLSARRSGHASAASDPAVTRNVSVVEQVDRLIESATSLEHLAQCYVGWLPFW